MSKNDLDIDSLFAAATNGDRGALARLLSLIERGGEPARDIARRAHRLTGKGYVVGITGAPGAGKSSLTSALIGKLRKAGERVAVLAIDPSSPFTGGAILGDRVRMQDHALDAGVFIRSMATRGHQGGLSVATSESVRLLDALGFPWIVVETVGVGQVEVEIVGKADTTVVVVNPGWGDSVQANKAGLMEIADVFAINKSDRAGASETRRDIENMLELTEFDEGEWRPTITLTVATSGEGVEDLWSAIRTHRDHLEKAGELGARRSARLREELREIIERRLEERARELCQGDRWDALRRDVETSAIDPWSAADEMLKGVGA